jgi:hypothetical protein
MILTTAIKNVPQLRKNKGPASIKMVEFGDDDEDVVLD